MYFFTFSTISWLQTDFSEVWSLFVIDWLPEKTVSLREKYKLIKVAPKFKVKRLIFFWIEVHE